MPDAALPSEFSAQLRAFIHFAGATGQSLPVTLNVGGFLVSGIIVNPRQHFQDLAQALEHDPRYVMMQLEGDVDRLRRQTEEKTGAVARYHEDVILLRDVKVLLPSGHTIELSLWHGRIDAVAGFTHGTLEVS